MYMGLRVPGEPNMVLLWDKGAGSELDPRHDLWNHSPSGFEWGYGGSGPAQLALALLADALGDDGLAVRLHQAFKREIVRAIKGPFWAMSEDFIRDWALSKCADLLAEVCDLTTPEREEEERG